MNRHYTDPKIYPANPSSNDMGKDWFIWFRIFDPASRRWIQKSYKRGINNFKRYRERLAEANAVRQDLVEALKEGWTPFNKGQSPVKDIRITTVREALDHIMNIKSRDVKKKTKGTYQFIIDLLKQWLGKRGQKDLELDRFTHNMAQQYMDDLLIDRNYSGRTYNDHIIILSTFFNVIAKRKWINENPFHNIERKKTTTGRNLAYTDHEKEQLRKLLHKKDRQLYFLTQFMYYCFIRRTEMVKIKVSDINLHTKTIIIRGDNAKNGMQESVVIPVGLEPILEEMRIHHYPDEHYIFGRHLFPSDIPYANVNHITTRHSKFTKQLQFDQQKGLYSWKHTGVCAAYYATGKDVYALMRQLRHKELTTTMIYLKSLGLIQNDAFRNSMIA